jgi:hypothetical protein
VFKVEKSCFQAKKESRRLEPTGLAGRIDAAEAAFHAHGSEIMEDLPAITGIKAGMALDNHLSGA